MDNSGTPVMLIFGLVTSLRSPRKARQWIC